MLNDEFTDYFGLNKSLMEVKLKEHRSSKLSTGSHYGNCYSWHFGWRLEIKKHKILIVGGFPSADNKIFGGIVTSCVTLIRSSFSQKFEVLTVDSTQSNPIPPLFIRSYFASIRILSFLIKLILHRPKVVILFQQ